MDMFNKIKSAVVSALPGFPLSKDFEVCNQIASAGPDNIWKIYRAAKRSTKQEASVFVLEKKLLDSFSRGDKDYILDVLRKGVSQLTRLRHPNILSVLQPMEETREMVAFATESVFASLSNVLGNHKNLPNPIPKELHSYKLYEVEIKYGLIQVLEGLAFLHHDVKMIHRNICPESIIINKNGCWKLSAFHCSISSSNPSDQAPFFPFMEWNVRSPSIIQPNLDYLAPEYALTLTNVPESDMFSFGILFYALFNDGNTPYTCDNQYSSFKQNVEKLKRLRSSLGSTPEEMKECVKLMLNTEPSVRPDPHQLSKMAYFTEDVGTVTLQYLENLFQQENLQKSHFFKGLTKVIPKFPKRINMQRVFPPLLNELVNPDMVPFLLPNFFIIIEKSTEREFMESIFPKILPIFSMKEPVQIMYLLLQNMMLLLNKTSTEASKTHVLPMVYRALESPSVDIQEMSLNIIPTFAGMLEFTTLRKSVIPRIKGICMETSTVTARVNGLVCLGKLLEFMDKWSVQDDVIPFLSKIPSREPAVLMSILGICKIAFSHQKLGISKDIVISAVLPCLLPMAFDSNLNLAQFNAFMSIIRDMLGHVESEQRSKLEQLNSLQSEQKTIEFSKLALSGDTLNESTDKPDTMMDKFLSGVGLTSLFNTPTVPSLNDPIPNPKVTTSPTRVTTSPLHKPSLPNQPNKVSLTFEEKQKLAKQQEQTHVYKSQPALNPVNPTKPVQKVSQTKDLSSTLMDRNLSNLAKTPLSGSSCVVPPTPQYPAHFSSLAAQSTSPIPSSQQKIDLSAFDSLLPGKQKQSLNTLSSQSPMNQGKTFPPYNANFGNTAAMPTNINVAPWGNISQQRNPFQQSGQFKQQNGQFGMANTMPYSSMSIPNTGQWAVNSNVKIPNQSNSKLTKDDLNDFLG